MIFNRKPTMPAKRCEAMDGTIGDPFRGAPYGEKTDPATLTMAASVVGIGSGIKNLTSGGSSSSGTQAQSPWQLSGFGDESAQMLAQLMRGGVGGVMDDPGFQAWNKLGEQGVQRGLAATGQTQSGAEQIALNDYNKASAMSFYDKSLSQLGNLSGVQFGAQGAGTNAQFQQGGWQGIGQGIGGLSSIYKGTSPGGYTPGQGSNFIDTSYQSVGGW